MNGRTEFVIRLAENSTLMRYYREGHEGMSAHEYATTFSNREEAEQAAASISLGLHLHERCNVNIEEITILEAGKPPVDRPNRPIHKISIAIEADESDTETGPDFVSIDVVAKDRSEAIWLVSMAIENIVSLQHWARQIS